MKAFAAFDSEHNYVEGTLRDSESAVVEALVNRLKLGQAKVASLGYYTKEVAVVQPVKDDDGSSGATAESGASSPSREEGDDGEKTEGTEPRPTSTKAKPGKNKD